MNHKTSQQSGEAHFIAHYVAPIKDAIIFDVGANVGCYSRDIRQLNPSSTIHAFEPHPITFKKLEHNNIGTGIHIHNAGVGSQQGTLELFDYADEDGSTHASLYKDVIEEIHHGKAIGHTVQVISLDDFIGEHQIPYISLLKIDTEGHELEVLKGAINFINANKVKLIHFEFNEMNIASKVSFKDFWDLLPGYDFYRMLPDGLVKVDHYTPTYCEIYAFQNIVAMLKQ